MKDGKNKILVAAYEILREVRDPEKVTVREVARRAGVGTGLINYHFASKDAMMMEAFGKALSGVALRQSTATTGLQDDPRSQLRQMLSEWMEMGAEHFYLIRLAARFELTEGDMITPLFILPLILQITKKEEPIAKMIAFSMISNIQAAALRREQFRKYMGLDILDRRDRERYIDWLLESHLSVAFNSSTRSKE
ncbi:MAG: TetR/AcrR family transcriptional regulator [Clostridiales bacterium]|nr:TetR/AcrR family transcriptional regulator [Clostridiales bacterium]